MHLVTSVEASHSKDKTYTLFPLALWTYVAPFSRSPIHFASSER